MLIRSQQINMQNNQNKDIKCILCGRAAFRIKGKKNGYQVIICNCGLVFINPQPLPEVTEKIYNQEYFSGGSNFGYQGINYLGKENEDWFKYIPGLTLKKIEKHLKHKGRLLDIGCAVGHFLETARNNGWGVSGIELSKFAREYAEKRLNINIYTTLEQSPFKNNDFDVITAFEIIEHTHNPANFLRKASSLLKEGGILGVSTPNLSNSKTSKTFMKWNYLTPPEHLFYFDKKTITKLLEANGFSVVEVFYGPFNPINSIAEMKVRKLKKIYQRFKPILKPVKKLIYDKPMEWYGQKSELGEDMIAIALKK